MWLFPLFVLKIILELKFEFLKKKVHNKIEYLKLQIVNICGYLL